MKLNTTQQFPMQDAFRPAALIVLLACLWPNVTFGQDAAAPGNSAAAEAVTSPAATDVPAAAIDGAKTGAAAAGTTKPAATQKPSNPFRTGESARGGGTAKKSPFAYNTGDTDATKTKPARKFTDPEPEPEKSLLQSGGNEETETRIVAPSFYGRGPQVITPGKGQYARPKYRYGLSVGIGYDDNPDQTPTVNLSAVARPRSRSGFTWVNGHWDAQWLKPRTVFSINLEAGGDFYWDRPNNSSDFNARLGMLYVNKIDPRTQFTANGSFAYLSQPDYSNQFASTSQVAGDYFTGSAKFDLSYRWAPHFSTVTSASVNILKYTTESATQLSNSYWTFVFGNEFRFQSSPRLTWIAEGRYGLDEYISNSALNSQTAYVLGGVDWIASRHMTTTFRAGASFRSYDAGGSSTAPYAEIALNYQMGRHSTLTLNGRYGFEQSSRAGDENLSYRLGLLYQQAFTSRFSGNAGFNFIHTDYNPRAGGSSSTDVFDVNIGLQYRIDRHFSVGTRYSYTLQDSSAGLQNFDRNRVLFSAQYEY